MKFLNLVVQRAQADSQDIGSLPPIACDPGKDTAYYCLFHVLERLVQWNTDLMVTVLAMAYRCRKVFASALYLGDKSTMRSATLRSSRTFPGQGFLSNAPRLDPNQVRLALVELAEFLRRGWIRRGMSPGRSRSGGRSIGTTCRR